MRYCSGVSGAGRKVEETYLYVERAESMKAYDGKGNGEPIIQLEDVSRIYDTGKVQVPALIDVNLDVADGEFLAIVGPSGSGKSTLLHVIGTLERPSTGVVRIGGVDAARLSDREVSLLRAREIGFVFQQFFLAEHATVRENVADGLLYVADVSGALHCLDAATGRPCWTLDTRQETWTSLLVADGRRDFQSLLERRLLRD